MAINSSHHSWVTTAQTIHLLAPGSCLGMSKAVHKLHLLGIAYLPHCCEHHLREGPFDCAVATLPLRFRPQLVDTTTLLHTFRLLARIFVIGSFAVVFLVLVSLLHGELAKALGCRDLANAETRHCRDEITMSCGAIIRYASFHGHSV